MTYDERMATYAFEIPVGGGFPVLLVGGAVASIHRALLRLSSRAECDLVAYCYLADRLIGVLDGGDAETALADFVRETGKELSRRKPQSRWDEVRLVEVADARAAARATLAAPVREGLARQAGTYPHAGSLVYSTDELV